MDLDPPSLTARRAPSDVPLLPRVGDRLAAATGRVATVVAPPGFGKTTQVQAWSAADGRAVAWLDLEPPDNDVATLVAAVLEELRPLGEFDLGGVAAAAASAEGLDEVVAPTICRALRRCPTPFILVLDDLHLIDGDRAIAFVDALARNVPPASTLVLISRAVPSAALARVRVNRGLVEISADQLALDVGDVTRLLTRMGVSVDDGAAGQLVEETDGWPVGVRLAAVALRQDAAAPTSIDPVQGPGRLAGDYVREEWLRGLSDHDVDFLSKASVLDWLSGPLCDHVLERSGSADELRRLHASRLVVIPLDRRRDSYRMHRLLRDVLEADRERTTPGAGLHLHRRASEWFEGRGDVDRAFHHAIAANDLLRAERLAERYAFELQSRGRFATVARWLSTFPDDVRTSRPSLCLVGAVAALGDPERDGVAVTTWMKFGEHAMKVQGADPDLALRWDAFTALAGVVPIDEGLERSQRARAGLAPGAWHAIATLAHGAARVEVGEHDVAEQLLREAVAEAEICGALTTLTVSKALLAFLLGRDGDLRHARAHVRAARRLLEEHGLERYPTQILVTAMSALVEAADGNPEQARTDWVLTRSSLERMQGVVPWANVLSRTALARASLYLSDPASACAVLDEAGVLLADRPGAIGLQVPVDELRELVQEARPRALRGAATLTSSELRVLHYLPTRMTLAEIASLLYVSRNTVKSHATAIYRKLAANDRSDAVARAQAMGLLPSESTSR